MADLLLLPTPLASDTLSLGQLLLDPLHPSTSSFSPSTLPPKHLESQPSYDDIISRDDAGHFLSSQASSPVSPTSSLLSLHADLAETIRLQHPAQAFNTLRKDTAAQAFLRKAALRNQPLYYVVGLRKLSNPVLKPTVPASANNSSPLPPTSIKTHNMPVHIRHDSATDVTEPITTSSDAVFGLEVQKVCAHLGSPSTPHSLEDIGYYWSYHTLDGDHETQLSIGLGKSLRPAELRAMAGLEEEGSEGDEGEWSDEWSDGSEDGQAGFESA